MPDDAWRDRSLSEILARDDFRTYYQDKTRLPPKLTRKQAAEADREERHQKFVLWLMTDRYGTWNHETI